MQEIEDKIEAIIKEKQYLKGQNEKEKLLLPIIKYQIRRAAKNNQYIKSYYGKIKLNLDKVESLSKIPFIPVQMFKNFDLRTCKKSEVVRILKSSSTTSHTPSQIPIDKTTAFRQTRALTSILSNFLGTKRRPFLVIDSANVNKPESLDITARGAAIRGLSSFAKETVYVLDDGNGDLELNLKRLKEFHERYKDQEILAFGFTYIIWSKFVKKMDEDKLKLRFKNITVLHGGGWKKLQTQKISKKIFSSKVAEIFSTKPENIIDFYGMAEQTGVIFLDCEHGYKHVPDFAEIIIRDQYTLEENPIGVPGIIEVISILPNSYPGQALLTEDIGELIDVDDCSCGRKGKYFVFTSRMEKAEIRGCGDTFAETVSHDWVLLA